MTFFKPAPHIEFFMWFEKSLKAPLPHPCSAVGSALKGLKAFSILLHITATYMCPFNPCRSPSGALLKPQAHTVHQ